MAASLIVAIGPQNAYLLKYGLARHRFVFAIAAIYIVIDVFLITLGAVGFGTLIAQHPLLKLCFAVVAGAFFFVFGIVSIRKALRPGRIEPPKVSGAAAYSTAIFLSLANPGVLFDTIVLIGGFAGQIRRYLRSRCVFGRRRVGVVFLVCRAVVPGVLRRRLYQRSSLEICRPRDRRPADRSGDLDHAGCPDHGPRDRLDLSGRNRLSAAPWPHRTVRK